MELWQHALPPSMLQRAARTAMLALPAGAALQQVPLNARLVSTQL